MAPIDEYINLLKANKNLILTGAPGTGKTFLAKSIAEEMGAETEFVQFHPSYDYTDFVEGLRPTRDKNNNIGFQRVDGIFKGFCKKAISTNSHKNISPQAPISSYRDALKFFKQDVRRSGVINIKSTRSTTTIGVTLRSTGVIGVTNSDKFSVSDEKMLNYLNSGTCPENDTYTRSIGSHISKHYKVTTNNQEAISEIEHRINNNTNNSFVFIIDEINRGEISKIFGELFFSIDPGYRGKEGKVKTQYQNLITDEDDPFKDGFYIPENVYIIGTMNDIDRSVESMDFAMRRRFAWAEIKATDNTDMLDELGNMKNEAIEIMNRLNKVIYDEETQDGIEGLSSAYHIGGAYFRKLLNYMDKPHDEALKALWDKHLKCLLYEYLRGTLNASENMNRLEAAFFKKSETVVNNQTEDDETD